MSMQLPASQGLDGFPDYLARSSVVILSPLVQPPPTLVAGGKNKILKAMILNRLLPGFFQNTEEQFQNCA